MTAPLAGRDWVHLAYVDDSGNNLKNDVVLYGGLIINEPWDYHFIERFRGLAAESIIPPERIDTFTEFKARDLFKGTKAFEQIPEKERFDAIDVLLMGPRHFKVRFIYSAVSRKSIQSGLLSTTDPRDMAFRLCLLGIEEWARKQNTSSQIASVEAGVQVDPRNFVILLVDDNLADPQLKTRQTDSFRQMRARWLPSGQKFNETRLWHFHDAMFFGDSRDSIGLQMADLFAYFVACHLAGGLDEKGEAFYQQILPHIECAKPQPEWAQYQHLLLEHRS